MNETRSPKRRTQAERSETTRTRLLEAAMKVVAKRGYSGFTTAEAARLAGVTRGALTHHFESKEAFVKAAVEHTFARILRRTEQRAIEAMSRDDVLRPMVEDATEYFFGGDFLAAFDVLMSVSKAGSKKLVRETGTKYRVPAERIWQDYLVARGYGKDVAEDVVWVTYSVVRGLAIRTLLDHQPARLDRTIEVVLEMLHDRLAKKDASSGSEPKPPTRRKQFRKGVENAR